MREKYITDEHTGLKYELVGDYYLIAGEDESEQEPIGIWGQRHRRYLKEHRRVRYANIDQQAEEMFELLVKQMAEREGVTEQLKAADQMGWVRRMNNIRNRAAEITTSELIYA